MVLLKSLPFFLLFGFSLGGEPLIKSREGKVFSLFSVVTFPNNQCTAKSSTSATEVLGTCFSNSECNAKGGTIDGNCAAGFGTCCTFLVSDCSSTVTQNCTYIQNPTYPSSYSTTGACDYNITPLSTDICQLRLDLDTFDTTDTQAAITGPPAYDAATCVDTLVITSGSSRVYPNLCGTLTGQHIYIETGRKSTNQVLTFNVQAASTVSTWRIKVSQIECHSPMKARRDCLQWFTGTSGSVKSFNFGVGMIGTMAYTVCVRREVGICGISWRESDTTSPDPFDLDAVLTAGVGFGANTAVDAFIQIPGAECDYYSGLVLSNDCTATIASGDTSGAAVTAYGMPFELGVNMVIAVAGVGGFHLDYNQVPCGSVSPQTTLV